MSNPDVLTALQNFIDAYPHKNFKVAFSGGLDSSVLLHALAQVSENVSAVHVDHGLSVNAKQWQQHCETFCKQLNIPLKSFSVHAKAAVGQSPEAAARQARYNILRQQINENDILVTAHHKNDQAETLLLQLLRGAGVKGLAAMPVVINFFQGLLARPLLNFTREQLQQYSEENQLTFIEDESNFDTSFDRNFLRHDIIPKLKQRWPGLDKTLARTAEHCANADMLLMELAEMDYQVCHFACDAESRLELPQISSSRGLTAGSLGSTRGLDSAVKPRNDRAKEYGKLNVNQCLSLSEPRLHNLLRFLLTQLNLPLPSQKKLAQLRSEVLLARVDVNPLLQWPGAEIRRYRDQIYIMAPLLPHDNSLVIPWLDTTQDLTLPNNLGILKALTQTFSGKVTIRFRQGGEKIRRGEQHIDLKNYLQEQGIPPWLRDRVPLLYCDEELITVLR